ALYVFFSIRRRHTRSNRDWSSDVCSSDLTKFYIPFDTFERDFTTGGILSVRKAKWYTVLDYTKMNVERIHDFYQTSAHIDKNLSNQFTGKEVTITLLDQLDSYFEAEDSIKFLL